MQKIFLSGPITSESAEKIRLDIAGLDRSKPLTLELNSDGGSVQAGITIHNTLAGWPGGLTVDILGWALSVASAIVQAGQLRRAHASALMMVHAPWMTTTGNAAEFRDQADLLDTVGNTLAGIYSRSGQPPTRIAKWLDGEDHWMTAQEAKDLGLIDKIIDTSNSAAPANAAATKFPIPHQFRERIFAMLTSTPTKATTNDISAAERQRRTDIRANFQLMARHPGVTELMAACEANPDISVNAANQRLLNHLGKDCSPIAGHWNPGAETNLMAEFKAAAVDVLMARGGLRLSETHPAARDLQRTSISGMAERVLSMRGTNTRDMGPAQIVASALGTSDFIELLSNVANKSLVSAYADAPAQYALFSSERDVADFKANTLANLSEAPALEQVPELAEYQHGAFSDAATTFSITTFGKIIKISRQSLVNDDLGAFTRLPASLGAAARRLEADHVFSRLTENPVLGDGLTLFSSAHGNVAASALPMTLAGLGAARSAMRKQRGLAGISWLDPQPKYLIVPVALETTAEQLLASLVDPSKNNDTPNLAFVRGLTLIADPRLDVSSETVWYLSAHPNQIEGIMRAYLAGQPRPYLEENTQFDSDAVSFKVRLDFGVGVVDHRGLYRSAPV